MKNFDKYEFNGFTYIKDYDSENPAAQIGHNIEKPQFIYKFFGLTEYSLDALKNNYLYASHPIELNDILDSSPFLLFTSEPIKFERYKVFFGDVLTKEELETFFEEDCNNEQLCKGYISQVYDVATNLFGIISTTGKENNPLMWPHYTQEKGFQIKFRTENLENNIKLKLNENEIFLGLFPANYVDKIAPIDINDFKTFLVPLYYAATIKSDQWKYENEWRFLIGKQNMGVPYSKSGLVQRNDYFVKKENRYAYYDKELIEEICLGMNFFNAREFEIEWKNDKEIQVKIIKENNWQYENQKGLLNEILENFSDKLYLSGVKYELDENDKHFLIRTKEKIEITLIDDQNYLLRRTDQIIKIID